MEIRQLKTFVATARLLSFTKAAEELGYAQSTVTGHIQSLEEEVGVLLYERFGKRIRLTREGEHLYEYANRIVSLSSEARESLASALTPQGSLTVGTAESLCIHRLPEVFKTFRGRYPRVDIKIDFDVGSDYRLMLRKNDIDIAVFLDVSCVDGDLITQVLFEEPMTLIAGPAHRLAGRRILPADLSGEALVLTAEGCTYRRVFEGLLMHAGTKPASVMGISSNEVIKRFVADGWGIGFLPQVVVARELADGQLVRLDWAGPPFCISAQMIYHKNKWLSPALKAFIDVTLGRLADGAAE